MSRLTRVFMERLKFYILIILIVTSLLQVGILWSYQNQGLPFNFMSIFTNSTNAKAMNDFALVQKDYFVPYSMIVSEDYHQSKWVLGKNDKEYDQLWNEAKFYLKTVLKSQPDEIVPLSDWGRLIDKRAFVFEFKTNIKVNLLEEFLNISDVPQTAPSGVYKMIISPWDNVNYNSTTIYIRDDSQIYAYNLFINQNGSLNDKDEYSAIISNLNLNASTEYGLIKEFDPNSQKGFNSDLLCVMSSNKYKKFSNVLSALPIGFGSNATDYDKVAQKILGSEKDSYDRSEDMDRTLEFKTMNNIYKVYANGLLEYNYLPTPDVADKGKMKEAFKKSTEFMNRMELQSNQTQLYLSGIQDKDNKYYEFYLDYMVDQVPVFINFTAKGEDNQPLQHAFVIRANSKNVISCKGLLRSFETIGVANTYNLSVIDFLNDAYIRYSVLKLNKDLVNKDIFITYQINSEQESKELVPVWVIKAGDTNYTVPIRKK